MPNQTGPDTALDTATDCTTVAKCLFDAGYRSIIRYYSRSTWKRLTPDEALTLCAAGLSLVAVYQNRQDRKADFSRKKGLQSARHAIEYASEVIFQPAGSAIYFAVDFDASDGDIADAVGPYFAGVKEAFAADDDTYRIGVYGSGEVCRAVLASGTARFAWLAAATGWAGYDAFKSSKDWHLLQHRQTSVCGIDVDPDTVNGDHGAFRLHPAELGPAIPPSG